MLNKSYYINEENNLGDSINKYEYIFKGYINDPPSLKDALNEMFNDSKTFINQIFSEVNNHLKANFSLIILKLRQKFLETAKSLIGIPYRKKYLEKHPDYDGDLFLDCCGLVRHTVNLLKDDFGFSLGRWNQAYQYDILPDEISFDEMQPGDLIFYSGIFYPDKNMKPQIHNMTYV